MQAKLFLTICGTLLIVVLSTAHSSRAGDLNPPVGPVLPTHKTLTEVEPQIAINATNTPGDATSLFRISQPGSYYLTGNITGVAGNVILVINATTAAAVTGNSGGTAPGSTDPSANFTF